MQPTNPNQFTEKAWQAIVRTTEIAKEARNQHIETEHLMKALLEQEGLAVSIFNKAEVNVQNLRDRTQEFINKQPKISNSGGSVYLGRSLDQLLDRTDKYRQEMGDEYISVEHLLLAYGQDSRFGQGLFREFGLSEPQLRTLTEQVRGNQKVTDQNPEGKYEALEKYGRDLTELAR